MSKLLATILAMFIFVMQTGIALAEEEVLCEPIEESREEMETILQMEEVDLPTNEPLEIAAPAKAGVADEAVPVWREIEQEESGDYDSEAMLEGYIRSMFYEEAIPKAKRYLAREGLSEIKKTIYDLLVPEIKKLAVGKLDAAEFSFPIKKLGVSRFTWTAEELGMTRFIPESRDNQWTVGQRLRSKYGLFDDDISFVSDIRRALQADYPYEMWWSSNNGSSADTKVEFVYEGETVRATAVWVQIGMAYGEGQLSSSYIKRAKTAAKKAKSIVRKHAKESDYKKLCSYRDEICNLTSYDYDVLSDRYDHPGDNHDYCYNLVAVFDGDNTTKAVCEGYAEAFQYLCDLSDFKGGVTSVYVTGGSGGRGSNHAWNIVRMSDGKSYLADVTYCDTGCGKDYFMKGCASGSVSKGYSFKHKKKTYTYYYDEDTVEMYGKDLLTIGKTDYKEIDASKITKISIIPSKTQKLKVGQTLFLSYATVPSGASAGVSWSSSKPSVAVVDEDGTVTALKRGTTKITVKIANRKTATITIKVVK